MTKAFCSSSLCAASSKKDPYLSQSSVISTSHTATRQPASNSRKHLHFIRLSPLPSPQTSQPLSSPLSYPASFLPPLPLTSLPPPLLPPPPVLPDHTLLLTQKFTPFTTQNSSCSSTAQIRPIQKLTNPSASSPPSSMAPSSSTVNEDSWRPSPWSTAACLSVETQLFRSPPPNRSQQLQWKDSPQWLLP